MKIRTYLEPRVNALTIMAVVIALVSAGAQSSHAGSAISISKAADSPSVHAGEPIGFTVTVTNPGPGPVANVTASDVLPTDAGTAWSLDSQSGSACTISAGTMTCSIGPLASGAVYTAHLTSGTTEVTAASSPVDNTATVKSAKGGSGTASASIQVVEQERVATETTPGPVIMTPAFCRWIISPWELCFAGTFNALVVAVNGTPVNEGTVTFLPTDMLGVSRSGCTARVANGRATCTLQPASLYSHVTATYSGSAIFKPSTGSI